MKLLIAVDLQKDFVYGALRNEYAIEKLPNVCEFIKNWDGKIITTMDTHGEDYLDTIEGKNLPVPHCIYGTEGWELCDEVKEALKGKEVIANVIKHTFGYNDWQNIDLGNEPLEEIVVLGYDTEYCVINNVSNVKATYPNVPLKVKENCCAGCSIQTHELALSLIKMWHVEII